MLGLRNYFIAGSIIIECDYYVYLDVLGDIKHALRRNGKASTSGVVMLQDAFDVSYKLHGTFLARVFAEIRIRRLIKKLNGQGIKTEQTWSI